MANQKVVDYIVKLEGAGISRQEIIEKLKNVGWPQGLVDEAFEQIGKAEVPVYDGSIAIAESWGAKPREAVPHAAALPEEMGAQTQNTARKNPVFKLAAFVLLFLVVGAGVALGAYWAVSYYFPTPEAVLERMTAKMAQAKTIESRGKSNVEIYYGYAGGYGIPTDGGSEDSGSQKMNFSFDFTSASDIRDADNPKMSVGVKLSDDKYLKGDFNFDLIAIGKVFYAKISSSSELLGSAYSQAGFTDKWLEIDYEKISAQLAKDNPQIAALTKSYKIPEISTSQINQIRELAAKTKMVAMESQLADESVDGVACRHYKLNIDKDGLREYVRGAGAIMQDQVSQAQIGQMVDIIGKADFSGVEIWVAKNDFTLRRVKGNMKYHDSYFGIIDYSIGFDCDINYSNIDKAIDIVAPTDAKPLYDILNDSMGNARAKARDARRQSDMRQMVSAEEMYYGETDRYYTCSASGGDCKGKPNNYPAGISNYITTSPKDPTNTGTICGRDYIYCGLDNTKDSQKFCFYAKLEGGGFYTSSDRGNFKRDTAPKNLDECGESNAGTVIVKPTGTAQGTVQSRDARRQSDMRQLISAQEMYYGETDRYYTCNANGGDCKGKTNNYPAGIGVYMTSMPVDPTNSGKACGKDYTYCGLDNTKDSQKFCFYAKLEGGGYYTASNQGSFKRSTVPANFADCGKSN